MCSIARQIRAFWVYSSVMVGERLRELRTARGLSLRSLAEETGLSATLLSQIERGVTEPSLKSLRRLAEVFGQSVSDLFDSDEPIAAHISRPGERSRISSPHGYIQYERLTPGNGQLEVLRGVLAAGERSSDEAWAHAAVECLYVTAGTLIAEVGGQRLEVLVGEALSFDSRQPHRYLNETDRPVEFILAVTPPTP